MRCHSSTGIVKCATKDKSSASGLRTDWARGGSCCSTLGQIPLGRKESADRGRKDSFLSVIFPGSHSCLSSAFISALVRVSRKNCSSSRRASLLKPLVDFGGGGSSLPSRIALRRFIRYSKCALCSPERNAVRTLCLAKSLREGMRLGCWHSPSGYSVPAAMESHEEDSASVRSDDTLLVDHKLSDQEIRQLVAFLHTLTSEEHFQPPTLP